MPSRALVFLFLAGLALPVFAVEDWKGQSPPERFNVGALAGLVIADGDPGFGAVGTAGFLVVPRGFVPDISNQVFLEVVAGGAFLRSTESLFLGAHLRWEFHKDDDWSFYGIGGVGSFVVVGAASPRHQNQIFPRVGLGAMFHLANGLALRGELSHELTALGAVFAF